MALEALTRYLERVAGRAGWTYHLTVRTPRGPVMLDVVMPPGGDPMDDYTVRDVRITGTK